MPTHVSPPTAELHLHIEGTLEPNAVVAMARRNGVAIPVTDPDELRARYAFADLQSFLDLHYANLTVLRTEEDFFELAGAYLDRARNCNVRRAEIFFDPQTHVENGVPIKAVMSGLTAAVGASERTHGISADIKEGIPEGMDVTDVLVQRRAAGGCGCATCTAWRDAHSTE